MDHPSRTCVVLRCLALFVMRRVGDADLTVPSRVPILRHPLPALLCVRCVRCCCCWPLPPAAATGRCHRPLPPATATGHCRRYCQAGVHGTHARPKAHGTQPRRSGPLCVDGYRPPKLRPEMTSGDWRGRQWRGPMGVVGSGVAQSTGAQRSRGPTAMIVHTDLSLSMSLTAPSRPRRCSRCCLWCLVCVFRARAPLSHSAATRFAPLGLFTVEPACLCPPSRSTDRPRPRRPSPSVKQRRQERVDESRGWLDLIAGQRAGVRRRERDEPPEGVVERSAEEVQKDSGQGHLMVRCVRTHASNTCACGVSGWWWRSGVHGREGGRFR